MNERQRDEIAALRAQLAAASQDGHHGSDEAMEALRQRNAELEKVILAPFLESTTESETDSCDTPLGLQRVSHDLAE